MKSSRVCRQSPDTEQLWMVSWQVTRSTVVEAEVLLGTEGKVHLENWCTRKGTQRAVFGRPVTLQLDWILSHINPTAPFECRYNDDGKAFSRHLESRQGTC